VAGIAAAYLLLVFVPGQRGIAELEAELAEKQDYVAGASDLAGAIAQTEEQLHKARAYNAAWTERAGALHRWPALYASIHDLATAAGTSPPRVEDHPIKTYQTLRRMPLALSCRGSFAEVFGLLERLEAYRAAMWEHDLKLTATGEDRETVQCELTLHVFAENSGNSN